MLFNCLPRLVDLEDAAEVTGVNTTFNFGQHKHGLRRDQETDPAQAGAGQR